MSKSNLVGAAILIVVFVTIFSAIAYVKGLFLTTMIFSLAAFYTSAILGGAYLLTKPTSNV